MAENQLTIVYKSLQPLGTSTSVSPFVEFSILRSAINARAKGKIGFGIVYNMVPPASWAQVGMLPIGTDVGQVPFLEIALP